MFDWLRKFSNKWNWSLLNFLIYNYLKHVEQVEWHHIIKFRIHFNIVHTHIDDFLFTRVLID